MKRLAWAFAGLVLSSAAWADAQIRDDLALPRSLNAPLGDPTRGFGIAASRQTGLCVLCHAIAGSAERQPSDIGASLAGAGARWTPDQLRMRLVDPKRFNPDSVMPSFHQVDGLTRVGAAWQGKPILNTQEVEDVVVWLVSLR